MSARRFLSSLLGHRVRWLSASSEKRSIINIDDERGERSTGLQDVGGLFSIYRKADRCLVNVGEVLKAVESTGCGEPTTD